MDIVKTHYDELEKIGRRHAKRILRPYGAWTAEELACMSTDEIYARVVWTSAGAAQDCASLHAYICGY